MVKFLLFILFILLPIIVLNYLMKGVYRVFGQSPHQRQRTREHRSQAKKPGDVHIDHVPDNKRGKFGDNYKGGEYVDYEEIK